MCEHCKGIFDASEVDGVLDTMDMFDQLKSYPFSKKPEQAKAHSCVSCTRVKVLDAAERKCNRREDEQGYTLYRDELMFLHRKQTITLYEKINKKK